MEGHMGYTVLPQLPEDAAGHGGLSWVLTALLLTGYFDFTEKMEEGVIIKLPFRDLW